MTLAGKKFHFIAAGGVGMSALAIYLSQRGAIVSGSDINDGKYLHLAEKAGVKVHIGHDASLIENDMTVVASSAVKADNPEIVRAKELGLKIFHRSDILKMISDEFSLRPGSYFIGFSGTHGKTTTSGLCAYVLEKAGLKPSYAVGGIIPEINANGCKNGDTYFSAELDESDGTIKKYSTDIAVINNMEEDHPDYYKNGFPDIADTFNEYLSNKPSQKVIINNDDKGNNEFMRMFPKYDYITFGLNNADYCAKNIEFSGFSSTFDVYFKGGFKNKIKLSVPGKHNVYNALAVYAALNEAGVDMNAVSHFFEGFSGMGRRFQKVCEAEGVEIYDDYAHHPSEIKTALKAASAVKQQGKRVVAIFQPHRYTRFSALFEDFKNAFVDADKLFITDVYAAGEEKIEAASPERFVKEIKGIDAEYISGDMEKAARKIAPELKKGDFVITLGAGTITKCGIYLKENLTGVCTVD